MDRLLFLPTLVILSGRLPWMLARLLVLTLCVSSNEPAGAAMAYGFGMETNYNGENSLLIFDLGGGIFIEELIVEALGTTGDSRPLR
ncbi:hypothetical protein OIU84_019833 [Salix udensis]|uniref:Uncharacterized protein n=1 Tax=Salix udensis TaxID=889485 RepID=A0AAD6KZV7_9ROSI|nr:hypothetical protein OIU84_019833 [Salix udensis]